MSRRRVEPLRLGKAAGPEPVEEGAFEPRPFPARQDGRIVRRRLSLVAKRFVETEGVNQHPPSAAPEGRRDLSRQERGGRAGDDHLRAFGVEEPPHETLPAGDDLDFVEVPDYRRGVIRVRGGAAVIGHDAAPCEPGQRLPQRVGELLSERLSQARVLCVHRRLSFPKGELPMMLSV